MKREITSASGVAPLCGLKREVIARDVILMRASRAGSKNHRRRGAALHKGAALLGSRMAQRKASNRNAERKCPLSTRLAEHCEIGMHKRGRGS